MHGRDRFAGKVRRIEAEIKRPLPDTGLIHLGGDGSDTIPALNVNFVSAKWARYVSVGAVRGQWYDFALAADAWTFPGTGRMDQRRLKKRGRWRSAVRRQAMIR